MRRMGKDLLRTKFDRDATSYWVRREPPGPEKSSLKRQFEEPPMSLFRELWEFMRVRKKFWLLPILIMMVVFGGLVVLTKGTVFAPFIYTLF